MKYVIALDAGTTSVRAFVFDLRSGRFIRGAQQEVGQSYPQPGWVEQDANEIYFKSAYVLNDCVNAVGAENVAGIGITNQRETAVMWNRETGEPVCPAIVWQCRRTDAFCAAIDGETCKRIKERTGLLPDAYFSASKIKWNLDHIPAARRLQAAGKLCAGTVDSYLIYKLTGGKAFVTDHTNASRTMLFDIRSLDYDAELLRYFSVSRDMLPEPRACTSRMGEAVFGGVKIPIAGVAGDQQAALYGQACLSEGDAKITYGTGLFLLFSTGEKCVSSENGLLTTIGYTTAEKTVYALEGSAFHAGSSVQWLRDGLGLLETSAESEQLARSVPDTGGVCFVPAFSGLGAPYWNGEARGLLSGLTRGTKKEHIVRAVLESIAYGARDLADCMQRDSKIRLREIKCDGGACANNFLMQFQSDVLGISVNRPCERESTALGAALLCAVSLGLTDEKEIVNLRKSEKIFTPAQDRSHVEQGYRDYCFAVERALLRK